MIAIIMNAEQNRELAGVVEGGLAYSDTHVSNWSSFYIRVGNKDRSIKVDVLAPFYVSISWSPNQIQVQSFIDNLIILS